MKSEKHREGMEAGYGNENCMEYMEGLRRDISYQNMFLAFHAG